MGGLITRHMLEIDQKGSDFIQHLIMMGTPNDGSEVAGLRDQVCGLITDALNVGGVMKLAISGFLRISAHLRRSRLQGSARTGVRYRVTVQNPVNPWKLSPH